MKGLLFCFVLCGFYLHDVEGGKVLTPLKGYYKFACLAENLLDSSTYYCDSYGRVRCLPGWSDPYNLCTTPVCTVKNQTCINGNCSKPFTCDCEVGWMGQFCEKCVPLPGCVNGYCNRSLECNCYPGWEGMSCDKPSCPYCVHGECVMPGMCACHPGWSGLNCDKCEPRLDCKYGRCVNEPFECQCFSKYGGVSCDKPTCKEGCHPEHGYCKIPETCWCKPGWTGPNCTECVPYWNCKNGKCIDNPWECVCDEGYVGPDCSVKGNVDGNWGLWGPWQNCSTDCGEGVQRRSRSCNYPAPAGNGTYCSHDGSSCHSLKKCYGRKCNGTSNSTTTEAGASWGPWGQWSNCSRSCGGGQRNRTRKCLIPGLCEKGLGKQLEKCNVRQCPVNGGYTKWTQWSPCTARCEDEVGDEVRRRNCTHPPPKHGGKSCKEQGLGDDNEKRSGCHGKTPRQTNNASDFCFAVEEQP